MRSVQTAGRTIVFSGATVVAALAVLLIFPLYFLCSFAYAGIGVVPACQRILGRAAWYAPAPLRRLQARIGLAEARG